MTTWYVTTDRDATPTEYADFDAALDAALEQAYAMADDRGVDRGKIDTFVNGVPGQGIWEAGAGPEGDPCAYWPHVEMRD